MSRNIIIKRILLVFLSVVTFFGTSCAKDVNFSIEKKKADIFKQDISFNGSVGLTYLRTKHNFQLLMRCSNDEQKEQAQNILNELTDKLINAGYADCLIQKEKESGYLWFSETKSRDGYRNFINVAIRFMEQPIEGIELWESSQNYS